MKEVRATNKHVFSARCQGGGLHLLLVPTDLEMQEQCPAEGASVRSTGPGLATTVIFCVEGGKEPDHAEVMVVKGASTFPHLGSSW